MGEISAQIEREQDKLFPVAQSVIPEEERYLVTQRIAEDMDQIQKERE